MESLETPFTTDSIAKSDDIQQEKEEKFSGIE
jgi:hypothetical protein